VHPRLRKMVKKVQAMMNHRMQKYSFQKMTVLTYLQMMKLMMMILMQFSMHSEQTKAMIARMAQIVVKGKMVHLQKWKMLRLIVKILNVGRRRGMRIS
jgi:hypothetical protein